MNGLIPTNYQREPYWQAESDARLEQWLIKQKELARVERIANDRITANQCNSISVSDA